MIFFAKASDELLVIITDVTSSVCSSCLGNRSVTLGREENFGTWHVVMLPRGMVVELTYSCGSVVRSSFNATSV
jgi:hypothetical protein